MGRRRGDKAAKDVGAAESKSKDDVTFNANEEWGEEITTSSNATSNLVSVSVDTLRNIISAEADKACTILAYDFAKRIDFLENQLLTVTTSSSLKLNTLVERFNDFVENQSISKCNILQELKKSTSLQMENSDQNKELNVIINEIKSQINDLKNKYAAVSITPSPPTLNERKMKESFTDVLLDQEQRKERSENNLIIFGIPESKKINIKERIEDDT